MSVILKLLFQFNLKFHQALKLQQTINIIYKLVDGIELIHKNFTNRPAWTCQRIKSLYQAGKFCGIEKVSYHLSDLVKILFCI